MRVLYFSRDLTTHDLRFLRAMVDGGRDVHFLRLERDQTTHVSEPLPAGVQCVDWRSGDSPVSSPEQLLALLPDFVRAVTALNPDLMQAGPIQTCALLGVLSQHRPVLAVSWGSDLLVDAHRDDWNRWATKTVLRAADGFLCDSDAVLESARPHLLLPQERILSIPWGLDHSRYEIEPQVRERMRRSLGWAGDEVVVVATRAWRVGFGVERVVEAFAAAHRADSRLRLVLAGDGPEAGNIRSRIASLDIEAFVHCPGMLAFESLTAHLAGADIYLSAVPSDGTSVSLLEAMRFGIPVVVPDNPGNREWVTDSVNGYLVDAGDVQAMADRVVRLAADPDTARRFGSESLRRVTARADWNASVPRLLALQELLAASPS